MSADIAEIYCSKDFQRVEYFDVYGGACTGCSLIPNELVC